MSTEILHRSDFSKLRYAQCWEDADILIEGLQIKPGDSCLSIASGGDNTLAMLTSSPAKVIAIDINPAQIACLELKVAAFKLLEYNELLELHGSRPSQRRPALFKRCLSNLSSPSKEIWQAQAHNISQGIGNLGKAEQYMRFLRKWVLPMIHTSARVNQLLAPKTPKERKLFYDEHWNNRRWRMLFRLFASRRALGRGGRDPEFYKYVNPGSASSLLEQMDTSLPRLDHSLNPYLTWALTGTHKEALPLALREENFETIRSNLDKLEWHCLSLEDILDQLPTDSIDRFNLSNIFEYMSPENHRIVLDSIIRVSRRDGRLAYWNFLVERKSAHQVPQLRYLSKISEQLNLKNKGFLSRSFIIDHITDSTRQTDYTS